MKKTEITLTVICFVTGIITMLGVPLFGVVFSLCMSLFSLLYLILGFAFLNDIGFTGLFKKASYKGIHPLNIIGTIGYGIAISTAILGTLFGVSGYTGAKEMLLIGLLSLALGFIIATVWFFIKRYDIYEAIAIRTAFWGFLSVILYVII